MTSLSPATIGEDRPPGALTFHFTFLPGPNSTGVFCPPPTPPPPGPRNCGHGPAGACADAVEASDQSARTQTASRLGRMKRTMRWDIIDSSSWVSRIDAIEHRTTDAQGGNDAMVAGELAF